MRTASSRPRRNGRRPPSAHDRTAPIRTRSPHPRRRRRHPEGRGDARARGRDPRRRSPAPLEAGYAILDDGGGAVDAVERAVRVMEDSPYFNAGHGAALTQRRQHRARRRDHGRPRPRRGRASPASTRIRNPIWPPAPSWSARRMSCSPAAGAEQFAREQGLPLAAQWYFFTPERLAALERVQAAKARKAAIERARQARHGRRGRARPGTAISPRRPPRAAMPTRCRAASATARSSAPAPTRTTRTVAVSGTGHGESFIKLVLGHRLSCLMELSGPAARGRRDSRFWRSSARSAAPAASSRSTRTGAVALPFNTPGMYRGIARNGRTGVAIFGDDVIDV